MTDLSPDSTADPVSTSTTDSPLTSTPTSSAASGKILRPPNLGPNPPGHVTPRFGLLDFEDIALFLWPWQIKKRDFTPEEHCIILKHRNPHLHDLTEERVANLMQWIDESEYITVEGKNIDMRNWRKQLKAGRLKKMTEQMEQDLDRATDIQRHKDNRTLKETVRTRWASKQSSTPHP